MLVMGSTVILFLSKLPTQQLLWSSCYSLTSYFYEANSPSFFGENQLIWVPSENRKSCSYPDLNSKGVQTNGSLSSESKNNAHNSRAREDWFDLMKICLIVFEQPKFWFSDSQISHYWLSIRKAKLLFADENRWLRTAVEYSTQSS